MLHPSFLTIYPDILITLFISLCRTNHSYFMLLQILPFSIFLGQFFSTLLHIFLVTYIMDTSNRNYIFLISLQLSCIVLNFPELLLGIHTIATLVLTLLSISLTIWNTSKFSTFSRVIQFPKPLLLSYKKIEKQEKGKQLIYLKLLICVLNGPKQQTNKKVKYMVPAL